MKKIVVTLLLFISFIGYSQTNGITYQAVILNPSGDQLPGVNNTNAPLANKYICLKFSIIDQNTQFEYIETVQTTTDEFGMVNLVIGSGDQIGGYASSFSTILWNANPKSLKVDLSTTGVCSDYTEISNQPFTAVPFALFAATAGTPGTPGPAGPQGIQGVAGPTGATGATGPVGPQGPIGLTGATGSQGLPGIQGVAGPTGATGAIGPVGPQGAQGLPGTNGTNGTNGVDGAVGATGSQGIQGLQGIQGVAGPIGAQGLPGTNGTNGTNGVDGAVGATGLQGLQGIQGVAGPTGATGAIGPVGPIGAQGLPGTNGTNGINGTNGVDGAVGASGLQGLQGIQGVAGPTGADGLQGLQGIQGPVGLQGVQGLQGIQGVAGPIGADGPQGLPGSDATVTVGAINSTSDPKGATISAGELKLAPANASNGGIVTTGTQTFAGSKTFNSNVIGNLSGNATTATNIAGGSLGQIPYQNNTNTTSFLPADTSTSRKFLSSVGSNGIATAPSWQPISPSDIISSSTLISGNLNFETSTFGSQSWTELNTQWNITDGWANLRDYNGTAYQGSYSIMALDSQDCTLQSSKDFNLISLYMKGDMSTATSIEFKGYNAAGVLVGSVIVNASAFNFNFSNVNLNFSGIRKLVFHPIGFDPNAMGGGSFFLDYFSVTFATSNNLSSVNGILKSNGNGEITAAVSGTDFLAPTGSAAGLTNFPTLNQNTTGTAANVSGVVAIANGGTAATTAAEALTNLGAAPIDSPTFTGVPLAPTPINTTNTTQIATTAFIQDLLLNAPTSSSSTLSGAIWTSATTGTLDGVGFTISSARSQTPSNWDLSTSDFSAAPLSVLQNIGGLSHGDDWVVTFASPITNLKLYCKWWRVADYVFDQPFTLLSGSGLTRTNSTTLTVSGWGNGIIQFAGPVTTLTVNSSADLINDASGQLITFASGVAGIASASGTGQVIRIDSPNLEGIPTAPTAAPGTNTTQIATTAFVTNAVSAATSGAFVDLTSAQTVAGAKTFSDGLTVINKPFLPTKLNQSQINSLTGVEEGMVVYNTDSRKLQVYSVGSTDVINDLFSGSFTDRYLEVFDQSFVSPTTGVITAIQFFVKSYYGSPYLDFNVDFQNSGGSNIGGGGYFNPSNNTTVAQWVNVAVNNAVVSSGQAFKFRIMTMIPELMFGTNSNYPNGALTELCCGGLANGNDVMFKILITPTNGSSAYWVNLN
jgi:hypothetical protein